MKTVRSLYLTTAPVGHQARLRLLQGKEVKPSQQGKKHFEDGEKSLSDNSTCGASGKASASSGQGGKAFPARKTHFEDYILHDWPSLHPAIFQKNLERGCGTEPRVELCLCPGHKKKLKVVTCIRGRNFTWHLRIQLLRLQWSIIRRIPRNCLTGHAKLDGLAHPLALEKVSIDYKLKGTSIMKL